MLQIYILPDSCQAGECSSTDKSGGIKRFYVPITLLIKYYQSGLSSSNNFATDISFTFCTSRLNV